MTNDVGCISIEEEKIRLIKNLEIFMTVQTVRIDECDNNGGAREQLFNNSLVSIFRSNHRVP